MQTQTRQCLRTKDRLEESHQNFWSTKRLPRNRRDSEQLLRNLGNCLIGFRFFWLYHDSLSYDSKILIPLLVLVIIEDFECRVATRSNSVVVSSHTNLKTPPVKPRPSIEGTVSTPYKMGLIAARKFEKERK